MTTTLRRVGMVAVSIQSILVFCSAIPAQAIARGYETQDTDLQVGMVAVLSKEGSAQVERATQDSADRVVGVVTTFDKSTVTLASSRANVLVESEGQVDAYISDMAGTVHQGDALTLSPLRGILMKSTEGSSGAVIAIAAANDTSETDISSYGYTDGGTQKSTKIGRLRVSLSHQGSSVAGSQQPSNLAQLGRAVVGKDVGEARVLVAMIIFIIVLIAEGGIIYGAVSSAITALGRNPLARKIIRNEMLRVIAVALLVLFVGLGAVYAVLWV